MCESYTKCDMRKQVYTVLLFRVPPFSGIIALRDMQKHVLHAKCKGGLVGSSLTASLLRCGVPISSFVQVCNEDVGLIFGHTWYAKLGYLNNYIFQFRLKPSLIPRTKS